MDEFYGGHGLYLLDLGDGIEGGLRVDEPGVSICQFVGEAEGWDLDISIDRFEQSVRNYLEDPARAATNVVMASWCGGVTNASESVIEHYLETMSGLEADYPGVVFVYNGGNWALEWQASHAEGPGGGWWNCPTDYHTQPVNRNQKAKAAWQMWCAIAEGM